jgi:hypothetical protein
VARESLSESTRNVMKFAKEWLMNWMPKNASRLNVIIAAVIAVDFMLWGLFLLVKARQEGRLAMTDPGHTLALFSTSAFLAWCSSAVESNTTA